MQPDQRARRTLTGRLAQSFAQAKRIFFPHRRAKTQRPFREWSSELCGETVEGE